MATSKIPTDKLTIDSTIVGILNFPAFFALQMPQIPKGMPAKNIIVLPHNPIISNKPNRKLEFKMFVGVKLHQTINGIKDVSTNSNQKNEIVCFCVSDIVITPLSNYTIYHLKLQCFVKV